MKDASVVSWISRCLCQMLANSPIVILCQIPQFVPKVADTQKLRPTQSFFDTKIGTPHTRNSVLAYVDPPPEATLKFVVDLTVGTPILPGSHQPVFARVDRGIPDLVESRAIVRS
jgi:hypothetical protein